MRASPPLLDYAVRIEDRDACRRCFTEERSTSAALPALTRTPSLSFENVVERNQHKSIGDGMAAEVKNAGSVFLVHGRTRYAMKGA
ncbi:hypothetical protein C5C36_06475 [Rathayibacter sp. AY1G1]|nr:hypothetical protein C5C36_06475 [Rathayibacter sp. AY1G1]PPH16349.1 hypothetical protein C5C35_10235 [Rathayibacter sp. AY1F8]